MLDEGTSALLQCVNDGCRVGAYKIFTLEDFSVALGKTVDEAAVDKILSYLQADGYLTVKYSGGGTYCVGALPQGALYSRREQERNSEEKSRLDAFTQNAFFGGLLGGVVGGFLSGAIALFVSLLMRR